MITPVYNGEKFIEACLQNVIDQNCAQVEHLILDAGSTDQTCEIIRKYSKQYPHIRWISEPDRGQSDAMNKGIRMAKGEIIGTLNVDDLYEDNALNRVLTEFQSLPQPSLLVGNCLVWDELLEQTWLSQPKRLSLVTLLSGITHLVNPSAYFYHAALHQQIGEYKLDEHYAMDVDFVLRAAMVAKLKYVDVTFGRYFMYADTKTALDTIAGQSAERKQYYLNLYTQKLSLLQQLNVQLLAQIHRLYKGIRTQAMT
ncbi:MAG: glycosyltransferase [Leptolyngbya sp. Prado105]|nr:glycosyltransferase [Leptolyngbya sp. Prado105]